MISNTTNTTTQPHTNTHAQRIQPRRTNWGTTDKATTKQAHRYHVDAKAKQSKATTSSNFSHVFFVAKHCLSCAEKKVRSHHVHRKRSPALRDRNSKLIFPTNNYSSTYYTVCQSNTRTRVQPCGVGVINLLVAGHSIQHFLSRRHGAKSFAQRSHHPTAKIQIVKE